MKIIKIFKLSLSLSNINLQIKHILLLNYCAFLAHLEWLLSRNNVSLMLVAVSKSSVFLEMLKINTVPETFYLPT